MVRSLYLVPALATSWVVGDVPSCPLADETSLLQNGVRRHNARSLQPSIPVQIPAKVIHGAFLQDEVVKAAPGQQSPFSWAIPDLPEVTNPGPFTGAPQPDGGLMQKVLLDEPTYGDIGGRCLDGQMSGYYYGKGTSSLWIFFFEGGGGCDSEEDCRDWMVRKMPNNWPPTLEGQGLLNSSNPDFAGAHRVYIPYCTGDGHNGQVVTPLNGCEDNDPETCCDNATRARELGIRYTSPDQCFNQWGLYFSGHLNTRAILHHIFSHEVDSRSMGDVVLTGTSAGGSGAVKTCDWLGTVLKDVIQGEVACSNVGLWVPPGYSDDHDDPYQGASFYPDFEANRPTSWAAQEASVSWKLNLQRRYLSPRCRRAYPNEEWRCNTPMILYPFIRPRMHITMNKFDTTSIGGMGLTGKVVFNSTHRAHKECTDTGRAFAAYIGRATETTVVEELKPQDGLFMASCYLHTNNIKHRGDALGTRTYVKGKDSLEAFTDWYFRRTDESTLVDDCTSEPPGFPCNPSCERTLLTSTQEEAPPECFIPRGL